MSDEMVLRTLTVTSCDEKYRGQSSKGEYVIYEVAALDHDGEPVSEDLRSFDSLPLGEEHEYEVTPYDHPKYGRSYTLKLPGAQRPTGSPSPGARLGPKVDALREQVESQDERIGRLEQRISDLEGRLQGGPSPGLQSAGSRFGDEVPF